LLIVAVVALLLFSGRLVRGGLVAEVPLVVVFDVVEEGVFFVLRNGEKAAFAELDGLVEKAAVRLNVKMPVVPFALLVVLIVFLALAVLAAVVVVVLVVLVVLQLFFVKSVVVEPKVSFFTMISDVLA